MISVIIPAYNSAATIVEALESVLAQSAWAKTELLSCQVAELPPAAHREEISCQVAELLRGGSPEGSPAASATTNNQQPATNALPEGVEVIIIDDCSTDNTVDVVNGWLGKNQLLSCSVAGLLREEPSGLFCNDLTTQQLNNSTTASWRLLRQERNVGPAAARNAGIAAAHGDWVAFLDADDVWLPGKLELQMRLAAEHPEVALWCGSVRAFGADQPVVQVQGGGSFIPLSLARMAQGNFVATSTVLVKKAVLDEVGGFDAHFRGPEDYDLWLRIAARHPMAQVKAQLARYRYSPGSLSLNDRTFLPQVLRVLDKAYGPGGALEGQSGKRRAQGYHTLSCAWMAAERGDLRRALTLWFRGTGCWPLPFRGPHTPLPWAHLKLLWCIARKTVR